MCSFIVFINPGVALGARATMHDLSGAIQRRNCHLRPLDVPAFLKVIIFSAVFCREDRWILMHPDAFCREECFDSILSTFFIGKNKVVFFTYERRGRGSETHLIGSHNHI